MLERVTVPLSLADVFALCERATEPADGIWFQTERGHAASRRIAEWFGGRDRRDPTLL